MSQLLTLYTTPVVYLYADRCNRWVRARIRRASRRREDLSGPGEDLAP